MREKTKNINVKLPPKEHLAFKKIAVGEEEKISDLIRLWIGDYIKKHEKKENL